MFKWISENHEIEFGLKKANYNKCSVCNKRISPGNTICDDCFIKDKEISNK